MNDIRIVKSQFIAAAVCPECNLVDRLVVDVGQRNNLTTESGAASSHPPETEFSRRRCVECGFADEYAPVSHIGFQGLPKGRPERPRTVSTEVTTIRVMNPKDSGL